MAMQWARWRDRVSLDIALVFVTLAFITVLERFLAIVNVQTTWIRPVGSSVLLAHPYLLLRVVSHFRPVSSALRRIAAIALAVSLAAVWAPRLHTMPMAALAFFYFVWLLAYVAFAFRERAGAAGGVTHWRMLHASWGAASFALVFILTVMIGLLPTTTNEAAASSRRARWRPR